MCGFMSIDSLTKLNINFHVYNALLKNEIALDVKKTKGVQTASDRNVHRLALAVFYFFEVTVSAVPTLLVLSAAVILAVPCFMLNPTHCCAMPQSVPQVLVYGVRRVGDLAIVLFSFFSAKVPRLDIHELSFYLNLVDKSSLLVNSIMPYLDKLANNDALDNIMLAHVSDILWSNGLLQRTEIIEACHNILNKHGPESIRIAPELFLRLDETLLNKLLLYNMLYDADLPRFKEKIFCRYNSLLQEAMDSGPMHAIILKKWIETCPDLMANWIKEKRRSVHCSSECEQAITEIKWPTTGLFLNDLKLLRSVFPNITTIHLEYDQIDSMGQVLEDWGEYANHFNYVVKWPLDYSQLRELTEDISPEELYPILEYFGFDENTDIHLLKMAFTGKGSTETFKEMVHHLENHPLKLLQQEVETDYEIKTENPESSVKIHKALLFVNSVTLSVSDSFLMKDNTECTLGKEIGATPETVKVIVDHCYTKKLTIPNGVDTREVIKLANYLGVQQAKDDAEDLLITAIKQTKNPSKQQLAEILAFAKRSDCHRLMAVVSFLSQ